MRSWYLPLVLMCSGAMADEQLAALYGVWIDGRWGAPFVIVKRNWIQVADCRYQHYAVLHVEHIRDTRVYFVKATDPILGHRRAAIRDIDCADSKPTFLELTVPDMPPIDAYLTMSECRSEIDLEKVRLARLANQPSPADVSCFSFGINGDMSRRHR